MEMIPGGATIWARKTIDSAIFYEKPDKWFKIWFFLVNRVNHKDFRKWKRGECHVTYTEIMEHTGATKNQIDHCVRFLKKEKMLATQKATRGMQLQVLKYSLYQDLSNYRSDTESDLKAKQKRNRSDTKNNNDNNEINTTEQSSEIISPLKEDNMAFGNKNYKGEDIGYEEPVLDIETGEEPIKPLKEKKKKVPDEIQQVFDLFDNPAKAVWYLRPIERESAKALYEAHGMEVLERRMKIIKEESQNKDNTFFPLITSPSTLLEKMPNVENFLRK